MLLKSKSREVRRVYCDKKRGNVSEGGKKRERPEDERRKRKKVREKYG